MAVFRRQCRLILVGALALTQFSCVNMIGSMAADTLTASIVNQSDPELIESGLPAYLLLVDGFIYQSPDSAGLLAAGTKIHALYGSSFSTEPEAALRFSLKARDYGRRSLCSVYETACFWDSLPYDEFQAALETVKSKHAGLLYAYALGWLSHLDATSTGMGAAADLPWVEAAMERVLVLDETHENGGVHTWLGVIKSLHPPALGGEPDIALAHFERSLELSSGRDLSVKVEFARRYGRLMYDQELHDRLLREVLAAPTEADGFTLFNVLAKKDAEALLATSSEYF